MFCQLLGVCESAETTSSLNQTLDGNLNNETIDSEVNNGTIPRQQIYQILEFLGLDLSSNNTITVNLTD